MIEPDTIKLLRECDAGIKMGVQSIDDVLDRVKDSDLQQLLGQYEDEGKDPNFMAEQMAKIKTKMKLQMDETDHTIADLITDGCNMGVKSLNQYLNQYAAADEKSKDIAKRLINLEGQLALDIRKFL